MTNTDKFATEEFGWVLEEHGDSRAWLADTRDMLQREVDSINNGTATAETYGFSVDLDFVQGNLTTIERINNALK